MPSSTTRRRWIWRPWISPASPPLEGEALLEAWPRGQGFVWNAGILVGPWSGVKLGLTYASREWLEMEGDVEARGELFDAYPATLDGTFFQPTPHPRIRAVRDQLAESTTSGRWDSTGPSGTTTSSSRAPDACRDS